MSDNAIENEIQAKGLTAPRVTPASIEENIQSEVTFTVGNAARALNVPASNSVDLLTITVLTLKNGFTVTGESACASPANFDAELGRKIARQNAISKIWPLMGYALKLDLHRQAESSAIMTGITFDEFVEYGILNGGNVVNGMPWSFKYKDLPVTHENDNTYLIGHHSVRFQRGQLLYVDNLGGIAVKN